jgi:BirA family biotin operon repressor/biotin-[acetyl-CoA-carboxylase] ligase
MAEAASELAERAVRCEWPNDLISDEAKVGGILGASSVLGGRMSHVILGLGVNLVAPPEVPGSGGIGEELDDMELLTCFLANFKNGYLPEDPGFAEHVGDRWRSVNITLGREVSATALDGSVVSGTAVDLDERGGLLIKTERGVVTVAFGDVARLD